MAGPAALRTRCVVVGGGPAGMMAGLLLAKLGVEVVVVEKHGDFFRDFRGDTVHPSTLEVMAELGYLDDLLKVPHAKLRQGAATLNGTSIVVADFSRLPTRCGYIAIMPQWDFLSFIAEKAKAFPTFSLRMKTEATDLLWDGDRVAGIKAGTPEGELHIKADLVIGADGRHSIVRSQAGFQAVDFGAPIDVLWMRLHKGTESKEQALGYFDSGRFLILIDRGDYFQTGFVIPKGTLDELKAKGLQGLRDEMVRLAPLVKDLVPALTDWDQVKLLTVRIDRLPVWHREGLLCIGDCAHAMSPAGGVGVNYAIQDAVATANLLGRALKAGPVPAARLADVQARREFPVKLIQAIQLRIHRRMAASWNHPPLTHIPLPLRFIRSFPPARHLIGRFLGLGPRPEHWRPR